MIQILKKTIILAVTLLAVIFACSKKNGTEPEPPKYKWTILGYFDGNNPQDQAQDGYSYVIKDVQELEKIDSTQDVQIVVMMGSIKTDGNCKYYHIQRHLDELQDSISSEVLSDLGKKDMSNPATLRDFISYGMEKYPAEHYLLIINDHGGGWKGLCSDAINGDGSWMSLPELSSALSGYTFDIIWFYTPSMATAEAAYQIKDRAEYMIASQYQWYPDNILGAIEPDSTAWLSFLTDDPGTNVRVFVNRIPRAIFAAAYNISEFKNVHSAAIYLPGMSTLAAHISNLGKSLIDSTGAYWNEVWDAWNLAGFYGDGDSAVVDLYEFAEQIKNSPNINQFIKANADSVAAWADEVVLAKFARPDYARVNGISIHLPWNRDDFDSLDYVQLDFAETNWQDFVSVLFQSFTNSYAGALDIKTVPTGANVYINDVDTGDTTNVVIRGLFPGTYLVKLVKTGYNDFTLSVHPAAHETIIIYKILSKPGL